MSPIPFSHLPFGNLHKRAASAFGSATITPVVASNIITSPAGMDEDNATASSSKTPLDMPSPQQSPTEQALGASADQLKLQDDHAKLQAEHQKLQQQTDTMKQQALIAKQQASIKAPAAPKNDSMGKYKSMSMQLMGAHLERVKQRKPLLRDFEQMALRADEDRALRDGGQLRRMGPEIRQVLEGLGNGEE